MTSRSSGREKKEGETRFGVCFGFQSAGVSGAAEMSAVPKVKAMSAKVDRKCERVMREEIEEVRQSWLRCEYLASFVFRKGQRANDDGREDNEEKLNTWNGVE